VGPNAAAPIAPPAKYGPDNDRPAAEIAERNVTLAYLKHPVTETAPLQFPETTKYENRKFDYEIFKG